MKPTSLRSETLNRKHRAVSQPEIATASERRSWKYFIGIVWFLTYILVNRGSFFGACYSKISKRVKLHSNSLDDFNAKTFSAIETTSIENFRASRTAWHRHFKKMAQAVENDFKDDDIGETCLHGVLQTYTGLNIMSLVLLGFIFVYFAYNPP